MPARVLRVLNFGGQLVQYSQALQFQELLCAARRSGAVQDTLVLLQHNSVYTIGKRGKETDFRIPTEDVRALGADIFTVPRGGEVTYHGPGQLVAYPIIDIRAAGFGARAFVEGLEDSVISTVGAYGIKGRGRLKGATGVWVDERKIAAIGVKISHGVSSHGLALNVNTDLSFFSHIVPCGIADKAVTSVGLELAERSGRKLEGATQTTGRQQQQEAQQQQQRQEQQQHEAQQASTERDSDAATASSAPGSTPGGSLPGHGASSGSSTLLRGNELYGDVTASFIGAFQRHLGYQAVEVHDTERSGWLQEHMGQLQCEQ